MLVSRKTMTVLPKETLSVKRCQRSCCNSLTMSCRNGDTTGLFLWSLQCGVETMSHARYQSEDRRHLRESMHQMLTLSI